MHPCLLRPLAPAALLLALSAPAAAQDRLPCPDCHPPKRFWAAAGELMAVQLLPWTFNAKIRDQEWADISLATWGDNLAFPWQWDNNMFLNNQFSHPYHGSLYFNAARTNGYDFWESAPWAFAGSLMWELFGEVWAPSPNDLLNTSLGGIGLGEVLFRLSSLTLDNTATGVDRTWREIGATALNPVRGFNRLLRGEVNDVTANPPDWRPGSIFGSLEAGYRRFATDVDVTDPDALDQGFVALRLVYGNQTDDLGRPPFSSFTLSGMVSSRSGGGRTLAELRARGNLGAREVFGESGRHRLAAFMHYAYLSNPVIEYGAQGFSGGLVTRSAGRKGPMLSGEALGAFMPIAAIRSDYFVTAEGRDYDYGVALGGSLVGRAAWAGRGALTLSASYVWLPVLSGFTGDHQLLSGTAEGRYYLGGRFGVGLAYSLFTRSSTYEQRPDVYQDASEGRIFLSLAVPRWTE